MYTLDSLFNLYFNFQPPLPTSARGKQSSASMGVPGRPGTGVLNRRLEQLQAKQQRRQLGSMRPDLGQVLGTVPQNGPKSEPEQQNPSVASSTLGTISSLLFGRKGGLL